MSSPADSNGIDLSTVFSPIYWGFVISVILGGITIVQAYLYFPHPTDRKSIQWTAVAMLLLDIASTALVAQSVYYYLVPHFGATFQFGSVTPELTTECMISGIITFISQMYFVRQLWSVKNQSRYGIFVVSLIAICGVLAFVGGTSCVVTMAIFKHGVLANRNSKFAIFFGLAKGLGALTDVIATVAMCAFLSNSKSGMVQTNSIIKSLIQYTVERAIAVTFIQVMLLITFYAMPNHLYWFAFHVNVTKLYANTFFAMLNARGHIKEKTQKFTTMTKSHGAVSSHLDMAVRTKMSDDDDIEIGNKRHSGNHEPKSDPMMPTVTKSVYVSEW